MSRRIQIRHGRKFPQRVSKEELYELVQEKLGECGVDVVAQAQFTSSMCKEVIGNKNRIFASLQPIIKLRTDPAWRAAFSVVLSFLDSYQMQVTLDTIQTEVQKQRIPSHMKILQKQDAQSYIRNLVLDTTQASKNTFRENVIEFSNHEQIPISNASMQAYALNKKTKTPTKTSPKISQTQPKQNTNTANASTRTNAYDNSLRSQQTPSRFDQQQSNKTNNNSSNYNSNNNRQSSFQSQPIDNQSYSSSDSASSKGNKVNTGFFNQQQHNKPQQNQFGLSSNISQQQTNSQRQRLFASPEIEDDNDDFEDKRQYQQTNRYSNKNPEPTQQSRFGLSNINNDSLQQQRPSDQKQQNRYMQNMNSGFDNKMQHQEPVQQSRFGLGNMNIAQNQNPNQISQNQNPQQSRFGLSSFNQTNEESPKPQQQSRFGLSMLNKPNDSQSQQQQDIPQQFAQQQQQQNRFGIGSFANSPQQQQQIQKSQMTTNHQNLSNNNSQTDNDAHDMQSIDDFEEVEDIDDDKGNMNDVKDEVEEGAKDIEEDEIGDDDMFIDVVEDLPSDTNNQSKNSEKETNLEGNDFEVDDVYSENDEIEEIPSNNKVTDNTSNYNNPNPINTAHNVSENGSMEMGEEEEEIMDDIIPDEFLDDIPSIEDEQNDSQDTGFPAVPQAPPGSPMGSEADQSNNGIADDFEVDVVDDVVDDFVEDDANSNVDEFDDMSIDDDFDLGT